MRRFILLVTLLVLTPSFVFAGNLELKNQHAFRYDLSGDEDDLYLTRLWIEAKYNLTAAGKTLIISPFVETRYHFDKEKWYRTELGLELGIEMFKWLYLGESLQYAWLDPDDIPEIETRLVVSFPFKIKTFNLKPYFFEEHTFDLEDMEGARNEIGVGLTLKIIEHIEVLIGWRHVDRIHDYDSDQMETALTFSF